MKILFCDRAERGDDSVQGFTFSVVFSRFMVSERVNRHTHGTQGVTPLRKGHGFLDGV